MSYWDVTNPAKPTGVKDPDSILDFPVDFSTWLTQENATYVSHEVLVTGGLVCDSQGVQASGVITPVFSGGTLGKASFTIRLTVNKSGITIKDDFTLYLKIKDK
jgi:hypothetical protein